MLGGFHYCPTFGSWFVLQTIHSEEISGVVTILLVLHILQLYQVITSNYKDVRIFEKEKLAVFMPMSF